VVFVEKDKKEFSNIKDSDCRILLGKTVLGLAENITEREQMSKNIKSLALPGAADRIAEEILKLAENK